MTEEQQLKLQAFLDGELPEKDTREMAEWLTRDADAAALLGELRNTRQALAEFGKPGSAGVSPAAALKVPESREFYWSKIQREIERSTPAPAPAKSASLFTLLRRVLMPLGAAAVLVLGGIFTFHQIAGGVRPVQVNALLGDAGAFTYRDESQGMTVVWLSYPAENKFAEKQPGDTLPAK
jgi:anti-sigma factor RsiW